MRSKPRATKYFASRKTAPGTETSLGRMKIKGAAWIEGNGSGLFGARSVFVCVNIGFRLTARTRFVQPFGCYVRRERLIIEDGREDGYILTRVLNLDESTLAARAEVLSLPYPIDYDLTLQPQMRLPRVVHNLHPHA